MLGGQNPSQGSLGEELVGLASWVSGCLGPKDSRSEEAKADQPPLCGFP